MCAPLCFFPSLFLLFCFFLYCFFISFCSFVSLLSFLRFSVHLFFFSDFFTLLFSMKHTSPPPQKKACIGFNSRRTRFGMASPSASSSSSPLSSCWSFGLFNYTKKGTIEPITTWTCGFRASSPSPSFSASFFSCFAGGCRPRVASSVSTSTVNR